MARKAVCSKHDEAYLVEQGCKWCSGISIRESAKIATSTEVLVTSSYYAKPNQEIRVDLLNTMQPPVIITLPDGAPVGSIVAVSISGGTVGRYVLILTSLDAFIGEGSLNYEISRDNEIVAFERYTETWQVIYHAG